MADATGFFNGLLAQPPAAAHDDDLAYQGVPAWRCLTCGEPTSPADFEEVDDEFNEARPRCPACQGAARLRCSTCEHCGEPAEYEVEFGFVCSEHHDHYVDGFRGAD